MILSIDIIKETLYIKLFLKHILVEKIILSEVIFNGFWNVECLMWKSNNYSPSFCLASLKLSSQLARLSGFANMTDIFSIPALQTKYTGVMWVTLQPRSNHHDLGMQYWARVAETWSKTILWEWSKDFTVLIL